jgi:endonuclease/exonuclease/phosphatase family metal-dependent hydrolase
MVLVCALVHAPVPLRAQLRIATYNLNIAQATGAQTARPDLATVLAAIGYEQVGGFARPIDVLLLQEQFSMATSAQSVVETLNSLYGPGVYARSTLNGAVSAPDGEGGRPGLVYNTRTVELVGELAFGRVGGSAQARQTLRYQLRPVGYDASADFYVYNNHYKASTGAENEARRLVEARAVRANADALGEGTPILFGGDFNVQSSAEASYQELLRPGPGQAFDPIQTPGTWHNNSSLRRVHTQSPATSSRYPGQATGGVDDRLDFLLVSNELRDGEGLSYLSGSYRAFGNNGTHACCNSPISSGNGASRDVLLALERTSDHLPVVADFQVPARLDATFGRIPESVPLGTLATLDFAVFNAADVLVPWGADELDYVWTATGALSGSGAGTLAALGPGQTHAVALDVSTPGVRTGTLVIEALSEAAAEPRIAWDIEYLVVDPLLNPSADFNRDGRVDGADLSVWGQAWGASAWGDADGDGQTGGADLLGWQRSFGSAAATLDVALRSVPEPEAWRALLACLAAAGLPRRVNRRPGLRIRSLSTSSPGGTARCGG